MNSSSVEIAVVLLDLQRPCSFGIIFEREGVGILHWLSPGVGSFLDLRIEEDSYG